MGVTLRMQMRRRVREAVLVTEDVFRVYAVDEYMVWVPKVAHVGLANAH